VRVILSKCLVITYKKYWYFPYHRAANFSSIRWILSLLNQNERSSEILFNISKLFAGFNLNQRKLHEKLSHAYRRINNTNIISSFKNLCCLMSFSSKSFAAENYATLLPWIIALIFKREILMLSVLYSLIWYCVRWNVMIASF
jgi:hypothetical protein